ncbi:MAG: Mur ligase family protein, partial [Acetobacterales bacterium]
MSALWTGPEVVETTRGRTAGAGARGWKASGVSIDSRTLEPGDLFVAIRGDRLDGHRFVAEAFAAGAAAAIVDSPVDGLPGNAALVWVADTTEALRDLGRAARARFQGKVAAVTGSVGKTGTKDALALVLSRQGETHASTGNLNNHWGLPLSLSRLPRSARYAVFELGMNHPGEISALSRLARPDVALITLIAPVHIEFFESIESIADAKAEIFHGMGTHGTAVLNRDDAQFARLRRAAETRGIGKILSFGTGADCFARLVSRALGPLGSDVETEIGGEPVGYRLGAPGEHWVQNSLAVLAAAHALGADAG